MSLEEVPAREFVMGAVVMALFAAFAVTRIKAVR